MQTFLPYSNFEKSLSVLDNKRLIKQIVECYQILQACFYRYEKGWINHPITVMWRGYEQSLIRYSIQCCIEYSERSMTTEEGGEIQYIKEHRLEDKILNDYISGPVESPPWLGDEDFHKSHRENLLRKDLKYYSLFFREDLPSNQYVWLTGGEKYILLAGEGDRYYYPLKSDEIKNLHELKLRLKSNLKFII